MSPTQPAISLPWAERLCPTLYEDELILAVAKPSGVPAGGGEEGASGGLAELIAALRAIGEILQPANRLGHYESGVLVLSKRPEFIATFRHALRAGRVKQRYVAVLSRPMPARTIPLDPASGASRGRRSRRQGKGPKSPAQPAGPHRAVVRTIRNEGQRSIVECQTTAPTTHALRAQLRAAGLRVLGDSVNAARSRGPAPSQTCLHLTSLELPHPQRGRLILKCPVPRDDFEAGLADAPNVIGPIRAALVRRLPLLGRPDTDSYRLIGPTGEGLNGLAAEKYGPLVVLQVYDDRDELRRALKPVASWYRTLFHTEAVLVRSFVARRGRSHPAVSATPAPASPLLGQVRSDPVVATENGLRFLIGPEEQVSVGLYLDQRDNRGRIRDISPGKDVLNLFAYTCGFSVAAAAGGARSTTSVDLSVKYLDWGRGNFELNGLNLADHEFLPSDAIEFLKFARRKQRRFDLILLDPPSFSHGRKRGKDFSIDRDLPALVRAAADVLRENGVIMVSSNLRRMSEKALTERVRAGAAGRRHRISARPRLPIDFAADPAHAKTLFVAFD